MPVESGGREPAADVHWLVSGRRSWSRIGYRRSPAAYVNAVVDALWSRGIDNLDMPVLPHRVWGALNGIDVKP